MADQEGVGYSQLTMKGGRRCSSAKAYFDTGAKLSKSEIITDAQTGKAIINDGRAIGVLIRRHGQMETIRARAEVIISAGVLIATNPDAFGDWCRRRIVPTWN